VHHKHSSGSGEPFHCLPHHPKSQTSVRERHRKERLFDEIGQRRRMDLLVERLVHQPMLRYGLYAEIIEHLIMTRKDNASMIILISIILLIVNLAAILILKQWIFSLILLAAPILFIVGVALLLWPPFIRQKHD
jgi:fatty acid desaturase